jgi:hypothetical protein
MGVAPWGATGPMRAVDEILCTTRAQAAPKDMESMLSPVTHVGQWLLLRFLEPAFRSRRLCRRGERSAAAHKYSLKPQGHCVVVSK